MSKKEKLQSLSERYKELTNECYDVGRQIDKLKREIWHDESGVNIGDLVSFMDGKVEKRGKLNSLDLSWSEPQPLVALFKKDGSQGTRVARVYRPDTMKKLNKDQNVQASVATEDQSSNKAD